MNKIFLLLVLSSLFLVVGCNDYNLFDESDDMIAGIHYPTSEQGEGYSVTYKYKESTIVYGAVAVNYLHHIEADTILYFKQETPDEYLPSVGDVVSARITDVTPYGLGNKCLSVSNEGDYIKCVTTPAALDEVFDELEYVYESDDLSDFGDKLEIYDGENDCWNKAASKHTAHDTQERKISAPHILPFKINKQGIRIHGATTIQGKFHASGNLSKGTFDFYFEPMLQIDVSAGINLEYNPNIFKDKNWFTAPLFRSPKVDIGVIEVGPVVLRPYVAANADLAFDASGKVELNMGQSFSFKSGYSQQKGAYINNTSSSPSDILKGASIDGNIGLEFKGKFDVGCGIYVKQVAAEITPNFTASFGLNARYDAIKAKNTEDCKFYCDIDAGLEGKIAVNLFGKLNLSPTFKIMDYKLVQLSWSLIPEYRRKTISIVGAGSPGTFKGSYSINGAVLGKFFPFTPAVNIYDKNHKFLRQQRIGEPMICTNNTVVNFNLSGFGHDEYYIRPCLIFKDLAGDVVENESDESLKITGKTTVEILEVRQVKHYLAEHNCSDNCGAEFHHVFDYVVSVKVDGVDNCLDCGYCADYIHNRRVYDGIYSSCGVKMVSEDTYAIPGSIHTTCGNQLFVIYPYVEYENGEIEVGNPVSVTFSDGSRGKSKHSKSNTSLCMPK